MKHIVIEEYTKEVKELGFDLFIENQINDNGFAHFGLSEIYIFENENIAKRLYESHISENENMEIILKGNKVAVYECVHRD